MVRKFKDTRLVVASHNSGKVREIAELLRPFGVTPVSASELGLPEPEETEDSFEGNACLKARAASMAAGLPAVSDDSGLCVDALGGAPGIYSARWAGASRDFYVAMARVERELRALGHKTSRAQFVCVLALSWPDGHCQTYRGTVEGDLVFPARGLNGFGYDPIFRALGHSQTFGEMDPQEKHALSHRARAFAAMIVSAFGD